MTQKQYALKPGEIRIDLLPLDWPLTPLGARKDPYITGWQNRPFGRDEIEKELTTGDCKAIGLLGGPVYNHPYGLVWVDIDGPSVYGVVEEISGLPFNDALPKTLTILSGKEGRERKLYRIERKNTSTSSAISTFGTAKPPLTKNLRFSGSVTRASSWVCTQKLLVTTRQKGKVLSGLRSYPKCLTGY